MSDWVTYDPERFSGFSQSDLVVDAETRRHFSRALCGVPDSYWELNGDQHFWAMTVPMRAIFARMPTRYPYYVASIRPGASAPTVRRLDTGNQQGSGQCCAKETAKASASKSSKRIRFMTESVTVADTHHSDDDVSANSGTVFAAASARNLQPTEVIRSQSVKKPGSSKTENVRSHSVSTNGTPEDAESLTDSEPERATKMSSGSASNTQQPSAPRQIIVTHAILSKNARQVHSQRTKRGGSVFSRLTSDSAACVPSLKLKDRLKQCKSWREAFKVALCRLFKHDELKDCTAAHVDPKRLMLAADLVCDYCRSRNQREPINKDFHSVYSKIRQSLHPFN